MWRRRIAVSTDGILSPLVLLVCSKIPTSPGRSDFGAGEGNRTLVVSLEGFCSTIELHPLGLCALSPDAHAAASGQAARGLTGRKPLPYQAIRMTHVNAIAAANTAR